MAETTEGLRNTLMIVAIEIAVFGALLAFVSRPVVGLRARRRGRAAGRRLRAAIDAVAEEEVLAPMFAVRADAARFRTAVEKARR